MITLKSQAETSRIAAANAVMLAQDTSHDVLLQWHEYEVLVFPDDTTGEVVRIMALPGSKVWEETLPMPPTRGHHQVFLPLQHERTVMTIFRATLSCPNEGTRTFVFECGDKDEATIVADDLLETFNEGLDEDSIHLYTLEEIDVLCLGGTTMELCTW